ncbi:MAG TPA: Gfo/Idh/MocA family oxidoreductase, partial [Armatimonadota bacterium]
TSSRFGFGMLGAGMIAPLHAHALKASEQADLIAIADVNEERLKKLTDEFGCKGYSTLEALLEDPAIQVINILTPNHLHHGAVLKAAKAGKHILVEKPPAMSLREVDEMIAVCQENKVKIGVVLQCRMRKSIQAMRNAIAQGRFGKILHADTYMKWYRSQEYYQMDAWRSSRRSGAGVTVQHAFHYIDLLQYLMGPVKEVYARMSNLAHPQVELEDTVLAMVHYQNGAQGIVEASTGMWPGTDIRIEVNGVDGTAIMSGERMVTWKFKEERPEDEAIRQYGNASVATGATGPTDLGFHDHQAVIEDMVEAIRTGSEPAITLSSVRPTLEWALAMYQSAKEGQPVSLPVVNEEQIWESPAGVAK